MAIDRPCASLFPCQHKIGGRTSTIILLALLVFTFISRPAWAIDTSNQSWVTYPYENTDSNFVLGDRSSFVGVSSVASDEQFAVFGAGSPKLTTWTVVCWPPQWPCGDTGVFANYEANPVYVVGPWDGSASSTLTITPPVNPLGVERFGSALDIHNGRIAVGASSVFTYTVDSDEDLVVFTTTQTAGAGRVHLYQIAGNVISPGITIVHGGLHEDFGAALALDSDHLLVGRPGASPGAADIFDPDTGTHLATLLSPGAADGFGAEVALAGDLAFIAAADASTVYVYRHDGSGNWNAAGTLDSPGSDTGFGASVAADGNRVIVGAPALDRAYIYEDDGDAIWPVIAELQGDADSAFGTAVALTGDTAFISAPTTYLFNSDIGLVVRHDRQNGTWPFTDTRFSRQAMDGDQFGARISASSTLLAVAQTGLITEQPNELYIHTDPALIWDTDGDGIVQFNDNCPNVRNSEQKDFDEDGAGDNCDIDQDNDGVWNPDEIAAGTDPRNPDTDGDGLNDLVDPDPLVSDLDRDGVGDDEEIANGTDPLDPDSDDDGVDDGDDPFPLDPYDGWVLIETLNMEYRKLALGDDVLLVLKSNGTLVALSRETGAWVNLALPTLDGSPLPPIAEIAMSGKHAVLLEKISLGFNYRFHVFAYDTASGWTKLDTANTSSTLGALTNIYQVAMDEQTVAVLATVANSPRHILIYELGPTGLQFLESRATGTGALAVSGDTVFLGQSGLNGGAGGVLVLEASNNYLPEEIRRPVEQSNPNQRLGQQVTAVNANAVLVGSEGGGFWLEKEAGEWQLSKLGIPPPFLFPATDFWLGGGGRQIVMHGLVDWRVYNGLSGSLWGILRNDNTSDRPVTNGVYIVHGDTNHNGTDKIEIYHPDLALPPGC